MESEPRYPTTPMCDGTLLERFEPTVRDSDVFIATAAKCGQTWLQTLVHHLETQGSDADMGGKGLLDVSPWLEIPWNPTTGEPYDRDARLEHLQALDDPRVFKMHVIYDEIPRPPGSGARIMTITRDPRDLPWSMYCHLLAMKDEFQPPWVSEGFEAYFERWMELGYFFRFVRSFWPHHADDDVLWLRFEDMKRDPHHQARRITEFLEWEVDDAALNRAVEWSSFEHMQTREKRRKLHSAFREDKDFVREGAVGKNRQRLSAEQRQRIVERARREFEPACFDFVMAG